MSEKLHWIGLGFDLKIRVKNVQQVPINYRAFFSRTFGFKTNFISNEIISITFFWKFQFYMTEISSSFNWIQKKSIIYYTDFSILFSSTKFCV